MEQIVKATNVSFAQYFAFLNFKLIKLKQRFINTIPQNLP